MNIYIKNMTLFIAFTLIGCNYGESATSNVNTFSNMSSKSNPEQSENIEYKRSKNANLSDVCTTHRTEKGLEISCKPEPMTDVLDSIELPLTEITVPTHQSSSADTFYKMDLTEIPIKKGTPEITKTEIIKPVSTVPPTPKFSDVCTTHRTEKGLEISCESPQTQPAPIISEIDASIEHERKFRLLTEGILTGLNQMFTEATELTRDAIDKVDLLWFQFIMPAGETEVEIVQTETTKPESTAHTTSSGTNSCTMLSTPEGFEINCEPQTTIQMTHQPTGHEKEIPLIIDGIPTTLDQLFAEITELTKDVSDMIDFSWEVIMTSDEDGIENPDFKRAHQPVKPTIEVIDTIPRPAPEITKTEIIKPVSTVPTTPNFSDVCTTHRTEAGLDISCKPEPVTDVLDTFELPLADITVPTNQSFSTDTSYVMDSTGITVKKGTSETTKTEFMKPVSTVPPTPKFSDLCTTHRTEEGLEISCKPEPVTDVLDTFELPLADITVPTNQSFSTDTSYVMDSTGVTVKKETPEITKTKIIKPVSTMPTSPDFSDACTTLSTTYGLKVRCKPQTVQLRRPTPTIPQTKHLSYPTDISVTDNCPLPAPAEVSNKLLITEVGHYYNNYRNWIEIYNAYPYAVDLSHYEVRSGYYLLQSVRKKLTLPRIILAPGKHFVIEVGKGNLSTNQLYRFDSNRYQDPLFWNESQTFVELFHRRQKRVEDYVAWTNHSYHEAENYIDDRTLSAVQQRAIWQGAFLNTWKATNYQTSFMRSYPYQDTNTAADWEQSSFITKGGVNDTSADARDDDGDGIPDSAERDPCATYNGLPYYAWGARPNQRDLFVEIDHMNQTGYAFATTREAIQLMQEAYAQHRAYRIVLHVDTGRAHSDQQQIDLDNHNLYTPNGISGIDGGQAVPYRQYATLDIGQHEQIADLNRYAVKYMDLRRTGVFHYILLADTFIQLNGQSYEPNTSTSGYAYVPGNDVLITFGSQKKQPSGWSMQLASTIVHEMGHNFGLSHGGLDRINRKINHPSVMNYLYSNYGVPNRQSGTRDAICYKFIYGSNASGIDEQRIDYSHGLQAEIDEKRLLNRESIYQRLHGFVNLSCERYGTYYDSGGDINEDGSLNVHKDYNEWGHIIHHFDYKRKKFGHRKEIN